MRLLLAALLAASAACGGASAQKPAADPNTQKPAVNEDPNRALTPPECQQAVDHVLGFQGSTPEEQQELDALKKERDRMIAQCAKEGKKKDLDCLMASKSLKELGGCEEPGGGGGQPAPAPAP
jgi:hypothetical protein